MTYPDDFINKVIQGDCLSICADYDRIDVWLKEFSQILKNEHEKYQKLLKEVRISVARFVVQNFGVNLMQLRMGTIVFVARIAILFGRKESTRLLGIQHKNKERIIQIGKGVLAVSMWLLDEVRSIWNGAYLFLSEIIIPAKIVAQEVKRIFIYGLKPTTLSHLQLSQNLGLGLIMD